MNQRNRGKTIVRIRLFYFSVKVFRTGELVTTKNNDRGFNQRLKGGGVDNVINL